MSHTQPELLVATLSFLSFANGSNKLLCNFVLYVVQLDVAIDLFTDTVAILNKLIINIIMGC